MPPASFVFIVDFCAEAADMNGEITNNIPAINTLNRAILVVLS
jgi:hypothetical protein